MPSYGALNWLKSILPSGSVTNTELANMAQSTIKGRAAGAGTGDPQDLTASQVRTLLSLVIGTDAQAWSAKLDALAAQTWAADTISYQTSTSAVSTTPLTAAARTVLDDATVAAMVDTLGGATSTGTGGIARATSPTFVTPTLGAATATSLDLGSGAVEDMFASTWTPTFTGVSNVTGTPTGTGYYIRVGVNVGFCLRISSSATAANTQTQVGFTLPIASNFGSSTQLVGTGGYQFGTTPAASYLISDSANDRGEMRYKSEAIGTHVYWCVGMYVIVA